MLKKLNDLLIEVKQKLLASSSEKSYQAIQAEIKSVREEYAQCISNMSEAENLIKDKKREIGKSELLVQKHMKRATKKKNEEEKKVENEKTRNFQKAVAALKAEIEALNNLVTEEKTREEILKEDLVQLEFKLQSWKVTRLSSVSDAKAKRAMKKTTDKVKLLNRYEQQIAKKEKAEEGRVRNNTNVAELELISDEDLEVISNEEFAKLDKEVLEQVASQLNNSVTEAKQALDLLQETKYSIELSISKAEKDIQTWEKRADRANKNNNPDLVKQALSRLKPYSDAQKSMTEQLKEHSKTTNKVRKAFEALETLKNRVDSALKKKVAREESEREPNTEEQES